MRINLALVAGLFLLPIAALADRVDDWAKVKMAENHIPGMVIGVYRHGKAMKLRAYGLADLEQHVPVRTDTLFEICSISKQFTSCAVLLLAQDGKLKLEDPLIKYVPELPGSWSQIKLREVLQHVSGIDDSVFDENFAFTPFITSVKRLAALPTPVPNQQWSYSNLGYWLMGRVIEKASGMPYYTFLQTRIFDPLQMKNTHPNNRETLISDRAHGYSWDPKVKTNVNAPMLTDVQGFGDGGLISTADDLNLWSESLKHGRLLSPDSRAQMLTPARLEGGDLAFAEGMSSGGYGLAVLLGGTSDHRIEKHSGGWANASAQLTRYLDDDLTVVVLLNEGLWLERPWIGEEIGSYYVKADVLPSWKPTLDPDPSVLAHLKSFASSVLSRKPDLSLLSPSTATVLPKYLDANIDFLHPIDFAHAKFVQKIPQGKKCLWLYRLERPRPQMFMLTLDAENKIDDYETYFIPSTSR